MRLDDAIFRLDQVFSLALEVIFSLWYHPNGIRCFLSVWRSCFYIMLAISITRHMMVGWTSFNTSEKWYELGVFLPGRCVSTIVCSCVCASRQKYQITWISSHSKPMWWIHFYVQNAYHILCYASRCEQMHAVYNDLFTLVYIVA